MNNQSVMIPLKKYQVLPKSIVLNKYKHKTFEERVAEQRLVEGQFAQHLAKALAPAVDAPDEGRQLRHDRNPIESLVII